MIMRNLVSMSDITRERWDALYSRCCDIISKPEEYIDSCRGKVLSTLFFEPSTRTNFSFQTAMMRLGGSVFGFSDPMGTSVAKGETLADTIRITASYSDTIVMRSPLEGAAAAAALYSHVPIINAGDGGRHHPTQTLTDLTTIAQKRGKIGDFSIGLCGDLKYGRTVHSLVEALSLFTGIHFYLISPHELRMPDYHLDSMRHNGQDYTETEHLAQILPELDILYMTRVQRERFRDAKQYERLRGFYVLNRELLNTAQPDMLLMHPLPRQSEISPDVDSDPRAVYFEQARYGMFIRMALLHNFVHQPRIAPPALSVSPLAAPCRNPVCVTQTEAYLPPLNRDENSVTRCKYCDEEIRWDIL